MEIAGKKKKKKKMKKKNNKNKKKILSDKSIRYADTCLRLLKFVAELKNFGFGEILVRPG